MFPAKEEVSMGEMKVKNTISNCIDAIEHLLNFLKTGFMQLFPKCYKNNIFNSVFKHRWKLSVSSNVATLGKKRKLEAINKVNHEDHSRNNQARNTNFS